MGCTIVVGGQFGDEGKGKIVSYLAVRDKPEIVVRGGVGTNAGHQVVHNGKKYSLRQIPCGFVYEKARLLVGAGVLVNPSVFLKEVEELGVKGRAGMDRRCTAIMQKHIDEDKGEGSKKIGTTGSGCGPAIMDRAARTAKLVSEIPELEGYLCDVPAELGKAENILVEGTQGFNLSLLYGSYPYVTSKDVSASTIAADVGIGPKRVDEVVMVVKAYTTRVGAGPFKEELSPEEADKLGFAEFGTVTGRRRRVSAKLHGNDLRYAAMVNSATQIALTKIDVVFSAAAGARSFANLPLSARQFVEKVESELQLPVTLIGTGAEVEHIIDRRRE